MLIDNNVYMVKTWTGEEKPVKKVTLFPERDKHGEIFYKIEGQLNTDYFMIQYYYDKDKAVNEFNKLLNALMNFQAGNLNADYI